MITFMSQLFATEAASPHISLVAEEVFTVFGFPITNSLVLGMVGYAVVLWVLFYVAGKVRRGGKNRFVSLVQWVFEGLYNTVQQVVGDAKVARRLAPLVISLFFFIIIQYWLGILPFVGPITVDGVPLFRGLAADLNTTFALAIVTIVMAQVYAIRHHGIIGNAKRYLRNPLKDPAGSFEGILELIAEFSRLMGLSLRLFGNVFAGEVLLLMIGFLTVWATPISLPPFMIFELFIGAVQAYIFFMLTTVFISLGLVSHGHSEAHGDPNSDHSLSDTRAKPVAAGSDS